MRYRGYYYDAESGFYYASSRYYDPAICRFINADEAALIGANGDFVGLNLFAYCGSNPISRKDSGGYFWETIWDIASVVSSALEVVANPVDPWAWAGLIGDVIDVALPGVGGLGEAVDAVKSTVRVVQGVDNVVDTARTLRRTADAADDIRRATGTYVVLFENGMNYVGKGGFNRAIRSAKKHMSASNNVSAIIWAPTSSQNSAFVAEFLVQTVYGVGDDVAENFNKIWSPGRKLFEILQ